jgi:hypothetical protein
VLFVFFHNDPFLSCSSSTATTANTAPFLPAKPLNAPASHHGERHGSMPAGSRDLQNYRENLAIHKKGLFRKKVSIATMLSWSKVCVCGCGVRFIGVFLFVSLLAMSWG